MSRLIPTNAWVECHAPNEIGGRSHCNLSFHSPHRNNREKPSLPQPGEEDWRRQAGKYEQCSTPDCLSNCACRKVHLYLPQRACPDKERQDRLDDERFRPGRQDRLAQVMTEQLISDCGEQILKVLSENVIRLCDRITETNYEFQQFSVLPKPQHGIRGAFDILNHSVAVHNH
jgi:hypothetical protein